MKESNLIKPLRPLVLLLAALGGSLAVSHLAAGQGRVGQFFACAQTVQSYTVPPGMTALVVVLNGAHGGCDAMKQGPSTLL